MSFTTADLESFLYFARQFFVVALYALQNPSVIGWNVPPALFLTPWFDSPHVYILAKLKAPKRVLLVLVDPRGVEPLSENSLIQPSTWVAYLLKFSYEAPLSRLLFGYHFNAWQIQVRSLGSCSPLGYAQSEATVLIGGTGGVKSHSTAANRPEGQLVRQP